MYVLLYVDSHDECAEQGDCYDTGAYGAINDVCMFEYVICKA